MARESWASRAGFILAAVGSAIGLGNIWRFPWMTAENGGSAFLLLYLLIVLVVGVPGLLAAFVIGRRSNRNPVGAFKSLAGSRFWTALGALCVVTSILLMSFYSVVGGWILRYFLESATGAYFAAPETHFAAISYGAEAFGYQLAVLAATSLIVAAGIRRGIEATTKVMMPGVVVLLIGLAIWAARQPGAAQGYEFYLGFDGAYLAENFLSVLASAAGQALFTLSIGSGTMITYASYVDDDRSLPLDASAIAVFNLGIGILAGLVVFPLLFSFAPGPTEGGPGALFVGIAGAFANLPGGRLLGAVFFLVVLLAALTSLISMLEIPVSFLVDEFDLERSTATWGLFALVAVTGGVNAFSPAVFTLFADQLVDLLLVLGLTGFMVYTAWVLGPAAIEEYLEGAGPISSPLVIPWRYAIGTVFPAFLLFTFYADVAALTGLSTGTGPLLVATLLTVLVLVFVARRSVSENRPEPSESAD
ncbi:sodium:neurotransmitter symporter [Haloterrigena turkmenica DSM 5511]|uniref:Sodium:neurotransmitter symporter n=1 Tax=Haloterrigena turkmenica (strain ATCC 51198 / DSM 5511 / JCM 9101 / NCIMB 13204 / VKM B-1734 / 4k) TaxID=543526 RepID=D2RT11_HALTV|nr:sodium-dependent transporter [Haloterrigena turkmenica]ADB60891.1 sodium:neurotransmitter symporter [Haloterrigena turkmenica DSM 5511]